MQKGYQIWKEFSDRMKEKNISAHAASSAFFLFLSLVPMLALLCMIIPYTPLTEANLTAAITELVPDAFGPLIKNLVSEAPLQKVDDIPVSTLEKMLVDIYCDPDFSYLQGSEYARIAENAMTIFNINKTKLLRYAKRRGVKEELERIYNEL